MKHHPLEFLRDSSLPLVRLLEPGPGFRIGSAKHQFALIDAEAGRWTYGEKSSALKVVVRLREVRETVVFSVTVRNDGDEAVRDLEVLEPLSCFFAHRAEDWRLIYANGGTTEHFYPPTAYRTQERSRGEQFFQIGSHPKGRSSNQDLPLLFALTSGTGDSEGLFCGMEWSGAWYMKMWKEDECRTGFSVGIPVHGIALSPGEALDLPDVHLGFFRGGPRGGTNALRRYLYKEVCPLYNGQPTLPRISYDHWFGIGNQLNLNRMKEQAKRAAELGVEVFVVDAAWFPGGFPEGVGNWDDVDRSKFPDGLEPLAEYVRGLKMDFGLWFEVERVFEGTTLHRQHPEWCVPVPGRESVPSYHLDLSFREAQDYVIEVVGSWIRRLDLRWSRWDCNIDPMPFWEKVDPTLKIQFDYFSGLYRVLDTLMSEHPQWMVEACSSGGRRLDLGTMRRAHTFWFSDQSESETLCRYMQARANRFLPGHLLNSSVAVAAGAGDAGFSDTSVLSRMLGKLGFDGYVTEWSSTLTSRMREWAEVFKAIRHLLVQDFYQLLSQPQAAEDWDAVQFVSYGGEEAIVFVFAGARGGKEVLRLHGLDSKRSYRVVRMPDYGSEIVSGKTLLNHGLEVSLPDEGAGLWQLRSE